MSSPDERHVAGIAQLLAGHSREALSTLADASEADHSPSAWSDLAAASYETALRYDAPELLAEGLAACDRALTLDRQFPEALFNRALIIERLGLRDDAREAWERYLTSDSSSPWAREAREHRDSLAAAKPFLEILNGKYELVGHDSAAAVSLVRDDPLGARATGLVDILGRWGHAEMRGHGDLDLAVARQLGIALARRGGDRMLERAVATIDASDAATRSRLARAHAGYSAGVKAYQNDRLTEAEETLRSAAIAFDESRSPMAVPARYFLAMTVFEQGRRDQSERDLETLLATVAPDYPAYRAQILWQLGTCYGSRADWGAAITTLEASASQFSRLGETGNDAAVRRVLAFGYDRIGDPTTAWKHRIVGLRGVGRQSGVALEQAISSIVDGAILRRDWQIAESFLNLQIELGRRLQDDLFLADALLMRAVVLDQRKDAHGAANDFHEATAAMSRLKDPAYHAYLHIAKLRATAMLGMTPPDQADALLTEAIDYQTKRGHTLDLPPLLLQRARARRSSGDHEGAMADLQRGIAELEEHRDSLPEGAERWGAFHSAAELFDEAVELRLSRGDVIGAFHFAERARARALLESYGRSSSVDLRRLPAGTVIVEYVVLPSRLVIFTADASGVRATSMAGERKACIAEIEAFARALRRASGRMTADRSAAAVYRRLIEPVASQLVGATAVVFVPDGVTSAVAFGALPDGRGKLLLEQHAIVIAPSVAAYVAAEERARRLHVPTSVFIMSVSRPGAGAGALAFVDAESQQIARRYARAASVKDEFADLDQLSRRASEFDVIHFAGHAVGDDRGIEPASLVLTEKGRERRVGVSEIARWKLRGTTVVVLAGCSTARGERRAAEGVMSVAHGFLLAGAPSVIATLWPIDDDAAATFFPRLHAHLAKGLPPAEALRAAQLESIQHGDVPASLWAAVQNIGS